MGIREVHNLSRRMIMHHRLFVRTISDPQNAHLVVLELHLKGESIMKRLIHLAMTVLFATLVLILAANTAMAQDPVKVDPKHYLGLSELSTSCAFTSSLASRGA